jgi:hypothetical protein
MPDLPPDPERLRAIERWLDEQVASNETVGVYLRLQLDAVREALAKVEGEQPAEPRPEPEPERPARQAKAAKRGAQKPPPLHTFTQRAGGGASGFTVELRAQAVGDQRVIVHTADCSSAGPADAIDPHDARGAIVAGAEPCRFCRPDAELGMEE